ncbi:MAG: alpha/beta hydrolase [Solirubrobacterales bacterium]
MRARTIPPVIVALVIAAVAAPPVSAFAAAAEPPARIVTWDGPTVGESRFVDPAAAPGGSYNEPPGVEDRTNALRVNVYLPAGYRERGPRHPVLFLLHGQGDAYDSWVNPENGDLLETAAGFPGVIVMPEGDRGFYANWWNGGRRGAPAWERYHLDELIPLVERRLRIRRARRWHAIAGLSMGGEGAMFYASQRPGYFGSAASFSGSLSIQRPSYEAAFELGSGQDREALFGDPDEQEFYWAGHNPRELVENLRHTRLYVAAGNGVPDPADPDQLDNLFGALAEAELGQQAGEFAEAARLAGAPVRYAPRQGIHDWPYWRRDLASAIEWGFFEPPPRPGGRWAYESVAAVGEAWGIRFRFADPPADVVRFERAGRMLSATGAGRVALRTADGCRVRARPPFARRLPKCSRS